MRKTPSAVSIVLSAICLVSLGGLRAYGQDAGKPNEHPNGIVHDWSNRHVAAPRFGEIHHLIAVQNDPRTIQSWQEVIRGEWRRWRTPPPIRIKPSGHTDWAIPLTLSPGTAANVVPKAMYPAKFGFDPTATPNCANDYAVFPVAATASSSQANLVGFNNLYSGTGGAVTGICNAGQPGITRTTGVDDDGVSATVMFSYAIAAAGGQVTTSPALSTDGTRIAFVETGTGTTAHFHVLAWKSGDGVAANLQTTTSPKQITSGFDGSAPAAGSGSVTDLTLTPASGTASDTFSSPFVDYTHDVAYIGNDSGTLFRVKNVFCTLASCAGAAPSLDSTWGTGGAKSTGCGGTLTGAVVDPGTGDVLVGCSNGDLYGFTSTGASLAGSPLVVGDGSAAGGIADPPLIDVVNGFAYVVTNSATSTHDATFVQVSTASFSSPAPILAATTMTGSTHPMRAPAFNNDYFVGGAVQVDAGIFDYASNSTGFQIFEVLFNASYRMNTETVGGPASTFFGSTELSPTTEFFNANTGLDWLFISALADGAGNVVNYDLSANADTFGAAPTAFASPTFGSGTGGIIVDNDSADGQAASVYFGALGDTTGQNAANCAVKLTQTAFQ